MKSKSEIEGTTQNPATFGIGLELLLAVSLTLDDNERRRLKPWTRWLHGKKPYLYQDDPYLRLEKLRAFYEEAWWYENHG